MQDYESKPVEPGFKFENTSSGGADYLPAPNEEPLEAHISGVEMVQSTDNFKTKGNGEPNPNFGKPKYQYSFKFKLDENETNGEASGQVYSGWLSTSMGEKSSLGALCKALFNDYYGLDGKTIDEVLGLPVRITLIPHKTKEGRQVIDWKRFFPAAKGQVKEEVAVPTADIILDDIPTDEQGKKDLDEFFGKLDDEEVKK